MTDRDGERLLDMVFQGGGARGLALNGAVAVLEDSGYGFRRLVGTSAGAITATLVAAGYTGKELHEVSFETNAAGVSRMTEFIGTPTDFSDDELMGSSLGAFFQRLHLPFVPERVGKSVELFMLHGMLALPLFPHVFSMLERGGYFSAHGFVKWLEEKLDAGGRNMSGLTLAELHERTGRHLSIVVSDTQRETMLVLNHLTAPDCPVVYAVRMSMSIPLFWPEVIWQEKWGRYFDMEVSGDGVVDGGVVSNFALRLLVSTEDWVQEIMGGPPDSEQEILGLSLDEQTPVPNAMPAQGLDSHVRASRAHGKMLTRLERVLNTLMAGNDLSEARAHPTLVCHLPVQGYGVTEFHMSRERITALMEAAADATRKWLKHHDGVRDVAHAQDRMAGTGS